MTDGKRFNCMPQSCCPLLPVCPTVISHPLAAGSSTSSALPFRSFPAWSCVSRRSLTNQDPPGGSLADSQPYVTRPPLPASESTIPSKPSYQSAALSTITKTLSAPLPPTFAPTTWLPTSRTKPTLHLRPRPLPPPLLSPLSTPVPTRVSPARRTLPPVQLFPQPQPRTGTIAVPPPRWTSAMETELDAAAATPAALAAAELRA